MLTDDVAQDTITDLLRSAWLIEQGRAGVYGRWAPTVDRFVASATRATERAALIKRCLAELGRRPDEALVAAHTAWIEGLAGSEPGEPLADFFVSRLGDWVDGHAGPFLGENSERLVSLGAEERETLAWPGELPAPLPYDPLPRLRPDPPGEVRFTFGILGDLHFGSERGEAMARAAIADLNASGAKLVVQLGDITDHGNADEFRLAAKVLGELEMPLTTMLGNHDVFSHQEERLAGREYYPESFGREPDGVLLEHEDVRFAVLDSAEIAASPFSAFDLVTGTFGPGPGGAVVRGALTPAQHEILAEVAAPGAPPAFVFMHHPPQPFTAFPPILFGLRDEDTGRLHATIDSGNVWGVFAGHTHRNARTRTFGTVPAQEVAIPRDYPFGFALVDVTNTGYAYRFVQLSDEELLRDAYKGAGRIHRNYARGTDEERAFVWTTPED